MDSIYEFQNGTLRVEGTKSEVIEVAYALIENGSNNISDLGYEIFEEFGIDVYAGVEDDIYNDVLDIFDDDDVALLAG